MKVNTLQAPLIEQASLSPSIQKLSLGVDVSRVASSTSFDSGYISEPKAKPTRSGFGFGMFFRKSQKSTTEEISTPEGFDLGYSTATQAPTETESLTL